ncbi:MAG TPA: glutathione S-transferase N-terminal domain-containing protein [Nevskiales bacterium]|nr:glutathione S-transferase N-terminal domain-containing protein [Nevskiales bacterium]
MRRRLDVTASILASTLRGWRGTMASAHTRQPERLLELYDIEDCPFCRLVRETLTELDLDALIYPCPRGGTRYRPVMQALGGKCQFPFLVDPNTGTQLYESADIIDYLWRTYRGRAAPKGLRALQVATASLASGARWPRGLKARASRAAEQPLELYSFESSPYSRLVRETLCELELPYVLRNTGKAEWQQLGPPEVRTTFFKDRPIRGRNRLRLYELTGRQQVPYLIDPNTGTAMFESADIRRYLLETYAI